MTQDMIQRHKSNTRNQKPDTRTQTGIMIFCKEEWANISISICASLVETYPKRLAAVIAAKGGSTQD